MNEASRATREMDDNYRAEASGFTLKQGETVVIVGVMDVVFSTRRCPSPLLPCPNLSAHTRATHRSYSQFTLFGFATRLKQPPPQPRLRAKTSPLSCHASLVELAECQ